MFIEEYYKCESGMNKSNPDYKYWLGFAKYDSVGSLTLLQIFEYFGSMKQAWNASHSDWMNLSEKTLRQKTIEEFKKYQDEVDLDSIEAELESKGIDFITIVDEKYPQLLKQIPDAPGTLFVQGNLDDCNLDRTLAVVGSRRCSRYAQDAIDSIIGGFKNTDATIVSGMALGIDASAHRAALKAGVKTIAVLGGGFDNIHPRTNLDIYKKLLEGNGAILSEYYPEVIPEAFRFPRRNRIVTGLSKGVLVGEASLKSGALISAKLCLEHNRELMCIPGMLNNPNTQGTHKLIKEGAGLVTDVNDILEYLNWQFVKDTAKSENKSSLKLLDNESLIYDILSLEPMPIDKIVNDSSLNIGDIMVILTSLELRGIIKQMPGEQYIRAL